MNIIGEYSIEYNIYTMFNVFNVKITNHNLITEKGYQFFLKKWYQDEIYPFELGYYHENKFYSKKNIDDTYDGDMSIEDDGSYSTSINYIDRDTFKQYKFDGENFVDFYEKLDKICIGKCNYSYENPINPSSKDTELYVPYKEYEVIDFERHSTELVLKCELENQYLNNTTEIGIKTNHGTLVSHDIHAPYNLPFGNNIIIEYVFKLQ